MGVVIGMNLSLRKNFPNRKEASFTLVELLVVVSIIGLLAGLGFPAISGAMKAGKKAEVAAMAESIKTAVNAFYAEYSIYPSNATGKTDADFLSMISATTPNGGNYRGIAFLEILPKFTNADGLVTPKGFYPGNSQSNFSIAIDTQGVGVLTNKVGSKSYVVPASISVWVSDPSDSTKPVGTFK